MTKPSARRFAFASLLAAAGCGAPEQDDGFRGLAENGHVLAQIAELSLEDAALDDSLRTAVLAPGGAEALEALVLCALPGDQEVTVDEPGGSYTFTGFWGLAPEWLDGPCDEACQEWVSACMMALVNAYGIEVTLLAKGRHAVLAAVPDFEARYTMQEGAFFGNLFTEPATRFACRGGGTDAWARSLRVCTVEGTTCGMDIVGTCGLRDGLTGMPTERRACEEEDERGAFLRCHDRPSDEGGERWPSDSRVYERVITVFMRDARYE